MNKSIRILNLATQLEGILCKALHCHRTNFAVQANDNLTKYDWKSPIYFALGHEYALSKNDENLKARIDDFLGNVFKGNSIEDLVLNYKFYDFSSENDAFCYVEETINWLRDILIKE